MATAESSFNREPKDCAAQLAAIAGQAVRMTVANGAAIAVRQNDKVVTVASFGDSVPAVGATVRPTSFAGRCIAEEKLLVCHDTETDASVDAASCRALKVRSMIAAPVVSDNQTIGVLAVFASWPNAFVENRVGLIRTLAGIAGELIALDRSRPPEPEAPKQENPPVPDMVVPVPPATPAITEPFASPVGQEPSVNEIIPAAEPVIAGVEPVTAAEPLPAAPPKPFDPGEIAPDSTTLEPVAPASHPLATLSPEELSSQLRQGTTADDLLLLSSFSPAKPESRRALKVTIVLIVVAVLAAGQWLMRDKIVGALRKYVLPRIQFVYPTKTEPASAPPAAVVPQSSAPVVNAAPVSSEAVPPPSVPTPATSPTTKPGTGLAVASKSTMAGAASSATPSELKPPHLLHRVEPVNPPNLKEEGAVVMNATVLQDGSIGKVTVVSGEPALRGAAIAAVKQWRYRPAYQNGQPVAVTVDVEVSFKQ